MLKILDKYHNQGLLYKQIHPNLPLTIWNYTEEVQYGNKWDETTLMARGLVTDELGTIVARPFKKFFNMEEMKHTPTTDFEVFEKVDGSLGIVFNYKGEWIIATRGSFTSEQSLKGFEMLQKYDYKSLHKDYTYLFEIVYNENRIVVNYPYEDLVLLGMINTKTGYEVDLFGDGDFRFKNMISNLGFKVVKKYDGIKDFNVLKSMVKDNEEGFVVRFSNGDRMKIKGQEYLRLHKIMTNVSTTFVWEMLSTKRKIEDVLVGVPDEFYDKIKSYVGDLRYAYMSVREDAGKRYDNYLENKNYSDLDRKEYALWVQRQPKHLQPILFRMFDGKDYSSYLWNLIKPEFKKL